ncbi:hypothetical protein SLA_7156 [Streptomyces laurentii]|uniref:Uncharacterized protein n=1 Tax=Streptomyces laurentii TaxID=39478 RepID=A0A169PIZ1_STRLU|nr:hypothetical protein SLA_7156 [Streptomyces laurentii]
MITMPAATSASAPIPSVLSVLASADRPRMNTIVISSLETTRVAVASIQPRRHRRATSQPPPAPAKIARVTRMRMPTLRTIITHQNRNAPTEAASAATTATSQPSPEIAPICETFTIRRTAEEMSVSAAAKSPSDKASTASMATVVTAMAPNANSTPDAVPVRAWARACPSRLKAAFTSWAQNVATSTSSPMGSSVS